MTATPLSTFATILFPPTLLTPGREVEVRVMRPAERMGASVGASLAAIGALAGQGKHRVASRKGDPSEPGRKPSVWLLKPTQLVEGDEHAYL